MPADDSAPPGVTVLICDAEGRSMGCASDFDRTTPGGFSLRETQEIRARDRAWRDVLVNCCHGDIAGVVAQSYSAREAVRTGLLRSKGWREHMIAHGHEEAPDDA